MTELEDPRLSALYRRAPASEPEARSDELILDAGRRAVRPNPGRRYVPWAVAATLVLGIGIGWRVLHHAPPPAGPIVHESSPAPAVEEVAPRPARAVPPAPVEAGSVETDSHAPAGAPFANMLGGAAKRLDRREAADASAPAAMVRKEQAVSSFARQAQEADVEAEKTSECDAYWPPAETDAEQWRIRIAQARTGGDAVQLRCLETRYRELFGGAAADLKRSTQDK